MTTDDIVNTSSHLANLAIGKMKGIAMTDETIYKSVLLACCDIPHLVSNQDIDDAIARIKSAIAKTPKG